MTPPRQRRLILTNSSSTLIRHIISEQFVDDSHSVRRLVTPMTPLVSPFREVEVPQMSRSPISFVIRYICSFCTTSNLLSFTIPLYFVLSQYLMCPRYVNTYKYEETHTCRWNLFHLLLPKWFLNCKLVTGPFPSPTRNVYRTVLLVKIK